MVRRGTGIDHCAFWLLFNYATFVSSNRPVDSKLPEKILEILVSCYDFDEENKVLTKQQKVFLLQELINGNMFPRRPSQVIRYGEILLHRFSKIPLVSKGRVLLAVGNAYQSRSQNDKAEECLKRSMRIAEGLKDKQLEATSYYSLGLLFRDEGQFDKSMKNLHKALKLSKEIFEDNGIANAYRALGSVYSIMGENTQAQQYMEKALKILENSGHAVEVGWCSHDLGNVYERLDENEKARDCYMKALRIASDLDDKEGEDRACSSLGTLHNKEGKLEQALHYHERSLKISRELGDTRGQAMSSNNLGNVYSRMGMTETAAEHIEKALRVATDENCRDVYGQTLYYLNLGSVHFVGGKYTSACENVCKSISLRDKLRNDFKQRDQFNMSMAKQDFNAHNTLTTILLILSYPKKALLVLDVGRSKALFDLLRLSSNRIDKNLLESQSVKWIEEIPNILAEPTKDGCAEICDNVFRSMESGSVLYFGFDKTSIVLFIWVLTPHRILLRTWSPPHSRTAQDFLRRVSSSYMQFHDAVTPSRCYLGFEDARNSLREKYVGMLSELPDNIENNLDSFQVPKDLLSDIKSKDSPETEHDEHEIGLHHLEEEEAVGKVASRGEDSQQKEVQINRCLSEAYQALIAPVEDILAGSKLVIVPDDSLFQLPFSALLNKYGKPLCDRYSVQLTPALHTLNFTLSNPMKPIGAAVCIGDPLLHRARFQGKVISPPPLPNAEKEATECATYFEAKPLLGKQATKKKVLQKMKNASVIHIAAHGNMEYGEIFLAPNPEAPSPPTEQHYLLMPEDISESSLAARLVVLSCCHTGRGEISSEGVVGTARAFLGAGARAVLVALWALPDEETREFMRLFYDNVCGGLSVCVALQQAMKAFKEKDDRMQVWAPFEIFGEDVTITGEDLKGIRRFSREETEK